MGTCSTLGVGKCKIPIIIMGGVAVFIWIYGFILGMISKSFRPRADLLNTKLFDWRLFGKNCCSAWPISHFILFFILGLIWPECNLLLLLAGILWEAMEEIGGRTGDIVYDRLKPKENKNIEYGRWWSASLKDIVFNIAGLYLGVGLRYLIEWMRKRNKEKDDKKKRNGKK